MLPILTHVDAKHRSEAVAPRVEYEVYLHLQKGTHFNGLLQARFTLRQTGNLFLDFSGTAPLTLQINDNAPLDLRVESAALYKKPKLHLPADQLVVGANVLRVKFDNQYNKGHFGNKGLVPFTSSDDLQYLYTQTEPFQLNHIIPVFDQPDLKATFRLQLLHPSDWTALSNTSPVRFHADHSRHLDDRQTLSGFDKLVLDECAGDFEHESQSLSVFGRTPLLSTYLFCLAAGPFAQIELAPSERLRGIPMRFFCRQQKARHGLEQYRYMFEALTKAIVFFEAFFGIEFPFAKWDFVMCPVFDHGAMEYPGCVTFNEASHMSDSETVPVAAKTESTRVIIHELAHMWFGNLVTMKWWDGLWLNESFAEFSAILCFSRIAPSLSYSVTDVQVYANVRKDWGYMDDSRSTTHPIVCPVPDTARALAIFDGITYSKGFAVLTQFYHLVGHQRISGNLKNYFTEFRWGNTETKDLFRHLAQGVSEINVHKWFEVWLTTSGTNCIQAQWGPTTPGGQTMALLQYPLLPKHQQLRMHYFELGFFDADAKLVTSDKVLLGAQPVTELRMKNCGYRALLPNCTDIDFLQIDLDPFSADFFVDNFWRLESKLHVMLVVKSLRRSLLSVQLSPLRFCDSLMKLLATRPAWQEVTKHIPRMISECVPWIPAAIRRACESRIFALMLEIVRKTDERAVLDLLKPYLLMYAGGPQEALVVAELLDEGHPLRQKLNIMKRDEAIIHRQMTHNESLYPKLREIYESKVPDSAFRYNLKFMEAATAGPGERLRLWEEEFFNAKHKMTYSELESGLRGFASSRAEKAHFRGRFFGDLVKLMMLEKSSSRLNLLLNFLAPTLDEDADVVSKLQAFGKQLSSATCLKVVENKIQKIRKRERMYANMQRNALKI